jgi:hypothetical protein
MFSLFSIFTPLGLRKLETRQNSVRDSGAFPNARAYVNAVDGFDAFERRARGRAYAIRVSELIMVED